MPHYSQALAALERLSEGFFTISWQELLSLSGLMLLKMA